jgi:hypothetical protein
MPQSKKLVIPGDPDGSRLFNSAARWGTIAGVPNMPKIGVDAPDPGVEQTLRDWINGISP